MKLVVSFCIQELGDLDMTAGIAGRGFFTDDASFIHVVFQEGHAAMLALSSRQMWGLSAQLRFLGIILQLSFSPLNKQP